MKIYTDKISALAHESSYPAHAGALRRGQVVVLSGNTVQPAQAEQTNAILGICLENLGTGHPAGAHVRVADSPSTVYICDAPQITASSGSTTTVGATALAAFADDAFNGGVLKFISAGASSTNTASPGDLFSISDYSATNKTFTFEETLSGAVKSGDKFQVFPPIGSSLGALNTSIDGIVLTTATSNFALRVVGWDTQAGKLLLMANTHIFGNKNV